MEHMPITRNSPWPHLKVPYYNCDRFGYNYTPPFHTWGQRNDYKPDGEFFYSEHVEGGYPDSLKPRLHAFVQSWLWFGLLNEYLQDRYSADEYITKNDNPDTGDMYQYSVTSRGLIDTLETWCSEIRHASDEGSVAELQRIDHLLSSAYHKYLDFTVSVIQFQWVNQDVPEELNLSITALLSTLTNARNLAFPDAPKHDFCLGGPYKTIKSRMVHDGWCPVAIERLTIGAEIATLYAAASMGPWSMLDHSACAGYRCSASQIDHKTYQTKHFYDACTCDMSRDLSEEVAAILHLDLIPVVHFNSETRKVEVQGIKLLGKDGPNFVAMSHVWSDGLGNLLQNSIPMCQLGRIQFQVNQAVQTQTPKIEQPCWFWLDTLCVPVGAKMKTARDTAIAQMVHVYRKANLTLILDAELQRITSDLESWEIALRINRAPWFNRLWTLHEGVISRKCAFQLNDCSITMEDLAHRSETQHGRIAQLIRRDVFQEVSRPYDAMARFRDLSLHERSRQIWSAVQWRNTSNLEDETICLANMLELDLSPILAIDRNHPNAQVERIKAFILQQKLFPEDSPFQSVSGISDEPMLLDPGFRWAPASFVFREGRYSTGETQLSKADSQGLHAILPGLLLGVNWNSFTELASCKSSLEMEDERVFNIVGNPFNNIAFMVRDQWDYHYSLRYKRSYVRNFDTQILESTVPAVLLLKDIVDEVIGSDGVPSEGHAKAPFYMDISDDNIDLDVSDDSDSEDSNYEYSIQSNALLVALQEHVPQSISSEQRTSGNDENVEAVGSKVVIVARALVTKMMFESSRRAVTFQIGHGCWPLREHPEDKIGWFESLPAQTKWCIE